MLAAVLLFTVLATAPITPPICVEIPSKFYASEWKHAKKLVKWEEKLAYPHHVRECSYEAYVRQPDGKFIQMYGTSRWSGGLDDVGRMMMEEIVTIYLPGNREQRVKTLTHEFIHILLGRLRHDHDPRGNVNDEKFICEVYPEGCNE